MMTSSSKLGLEPTTISAKLQQTNHRNPTHEPETEEELGHQTHTISSQPPIHKLLFPNTHDDLEELCAAAAAAAAPPN